MNHEQKKIKLLVEAAFGKSSSSKPLNTPHNVWSPVNQLTIYPLHSRAQNLLSQNRAKALDLGVWVNFFLKSPEFSIFFEFHIKSPKGLRCPNSLFNLNFVQMTKVFPHFASKHQNPKMQLNMCQEGVNDLSFLIQHNQSRFHPYLHLN